MAKVKKKELRNILDFQFKNLLEFCAETLENLQDGPDEVLSSRVIENVSHIEGRVYAIQNILLTQNLTTE